MTASHSLICATTVQLVENLKSSVVHFDESASLTNIRLFEGETLKTVSKSSRIHLPRVDLRRSQQERNSRLVTMHVVGVGKVQVFKANHYSMKDCDPSVFDKEFGKGYCEQYAEPPRKRGVAHHVFRFARGLEVSARVGLRGSRPQECGQHGVGVQDTSFPLSILRWRLEFILFHYNFKNLRLFDNGGRQPDVWTLSDVHRGAEFGRVIIGSVQQAVNLEGSVALKAVSKFSMGDFSREWIYVAARVRTSSVVTMHVVGVDKVQVLKANHYSLEDGEPLTCKEFVCGHIRAQVRLALALHHQHGCQRRGHYRAYVGLDNKRELNDDQEDNIVANSHISGSNAGDVISTIDHHRQGSTFTLHTDTGPRPSPT
eukprot:gene37479-46235_t